LGSSQDSGVLFKTLYDDTELKNLMLIPDTMKNNLAEIRKNYIVQSYGSDLITLTEKCRIIYRNVPSRQTNNEYCRFSDVIFEIFVNNTNEYIVPGFDRRQMLIADRLRTLLSTKRIGNWRYKAVDEGELYCSTQNYRRYYIRFEYKMVYI
jgi:hypothetical protein